MDSKSKKNTKTVDVLMNKRYLPITIGILLFIIFGTAFYLVYIDLERIKQHIHNDFNEQQLIIARQAASHMDIHLNALNRQLLDIKWLFDKNEKDIGRSALKKFLKNNSAIGILDTGLLSPEGETQAYFKVTAAIPAFNVEKALTEYNRDKLSGVILGDLEIHNTDKAKTFIISNLIVPVKTDSIRTDILFARIDLSIMFEVNLGRLSSGKTGYAWVINKKGRALYHPEKDFIGKDMFQARYEKEPIVNFTKRNKRMKENIIKGREGKSGYESWWHWGMKDRVAKLMAFTPIKSKFLSFDKIWSVAVVAPTSEVSDAVNTAYHRHLGAQAAIIIGMFLFVIIMILHKRRISFILKEQAAEQTRPVAQAAEHEEYIPAILKNTNTLDARQGLLIVDDEPDMVRSLERIIARKTAYDVITTTNALEVPELLEKHQFDVIISDQNMPGMGGMDILKYIKEKNRFEQVIMCTAFSSLDSEIEALSHGVFNYIIKPFNKEQILYTLKRAMLFQKIAREAGYLSDIFKLEPYNEAEHAFLKEYIRRLGAEYNYNEEEMKKKSGISEEIIHNELTKL